MSFRLKTFYFMIVSFASLIGLAITAGTIIYSAVQFFVITDEEYLQSNYRYELNQCEEPTYKPSTLPENLPEGTPKTQQEIIQCKAETRARVAIRRSVDFKKSLIGGLSWGVVFLIIFLCHFPTFRKLSDEK